MITITDIYRYPVKGLTPERLDRVRLAAGEALPFDRAYALALAGSAFDENAPGWVPKTNFLMLQRDEALAALHAHFDDATLTLRVTGPNGFFVEGRLDEEEGREVLAEAIGRYMGLTEAAEPRLVHAEGHTISDHPEAVVSIIHAASVAALAGAVGAEIDPVRFRGNLYIEGGAAWEEFGWVGKTIEIGEARLEVTQRIPRCAATGVNPATAVRDMNLVKALTEHFGHYDTGVYARVVAHGTVKIGDRLEIPA